MFPQLPGTLPAASPRLSIGNCPCCLWAWRGFGNANSHTGKCPERERAASPKDTQELVILEYKSPDAPCKFRTTLQGHGSSGATRGSAEASQCLYHSLTFNSVQSCYLPFPTGVHTKNPACIKWIPWSRGYEGSESRRSRRVGGY